jgi:flagellar basal body P-ring protein FlgI
VKRPLFFVWLTTFALLASVAVASLARGDGWFGSDKKPKAHKDDDESGDLDEYDARAKVPLVGEMTQVFGGNWIQLEGAGLVVDLRDAGEDPPPSEARHAVLEDMKRRGVPNPNKILKMPNTTVVLVTGYVPALIRKGDNFDVEVSLPPGSKVKSLNGGRLMPCYLREHLHDASGADHSSHDFATAVGPILVGSSHGNAADQAGVLRRGRVVAGGTWKWEDRNLDLYLRNDVRSERNSVRIAAAIGRRFFDYDRHGQRVPLAEAKTDQKIVLKIMPKYRDNFPRYLEVIRKIAFRETDVARAVRIRALKWDLLEPESSAQAALKLEAIGEQGIPTLKTGLKSNDPQVRFHSAEALAYLGDSSGLQALFEAARDQYAFRIFALAALASLEDPEVHAKLRDLMDVESAETRYGAFRALTTLDKNDPFVRGEDLNHQFRLHILRTDGPPMVHITNCKKAEVVLFGRDQEVKTPLFARAGKEIVVSATPGADGITLTRFEVGHEDQRKRVSKQLHDVIRGLTELGATFPDVNQFLVEADRQQNLAGRLEIDALPRAGRSYEPPDQGIAGKHRKQKNPVGNAENGPNMFAMGHDKKSKMKAEDQDDTGKDDSSQADSPPKRKKSTPADGDSAATGSASAKKSPDNSSQTVKQVSQSDSARSGPGNQSVKQAVDETDDSGTTTKPAPPPSRWSFWRLFKFGGGDVSGNTEP